MKEYGWFTINGNVPSKANNYRGTSNGFFKDKNVAAWEKGFTQQCLLPENRQLREIYVKGEFEYHVKVYYPSIRPDLDNSLKIQLDCLQHLGILKNDNRCVKIVAEKYIDKKNPRIEFKIVDKMEDLIELLEEIVEKADDFFDFGCHEDCMPYSPHEQINYAKKHRQLERVISKAKTRLKEYQ